MKNLKRIILAFIVIMTFQISAFADGVNSVLLRQKGLEAYSQGNYKAALQYLTAIPKAEHTLEIVICIANSYESIGDTRSAVLLLESLNRYNAGNYSAFYNLGNIYLKAKVYKNAIESYKISAKMNSKFAPTFYNLGITYFEIKDYNKALFNFQKAVRLDPTNKDYLYNTGVCYEAMGDKQSAAEYYRKAK